MVNRQKILIVDDDNNIAELIALYLTKECFETMIVNDGESALSAVDSFGPNLMLLDLMLPGIDGYQVCREVRAKSTLPDHHAFGQGRGVRPRCWGLSWAPMIHARSLFDSKELVARVESGAAPYKPVAAEPRASRRQERGVSGSDRQTGPIILLSTMGKTIEMPPKTGATLFFLASSPNHVLRERQLWIRSGVIISATPVP